jgi:hypothetical protein
VVVAVVVVAAAVAVAVGADGASGFARAGIGLVVFVAVDAVDVLGMLGMLGVLVTSGAAVAREGGATALAAASRGALDTAGRLALAFAAPSMSFAASAPPP